MKLFITLLVCLLFLSGCSIAADIQTAVVDKITTAVVDPILADNSGDQKKPTPTIGVIETPATLSLPVDPFSLEAVAQAANEQISRKAFISDTAIPLEIGNKLRVNTVDGKIQLSNVSGEGVNQEWAEGSINLIENGLDGANRLKLFLVYDHNQTGQGWQVLAATRSPEHDREDSQAYLAGLINQDLYKLNPYHLNN